MDRNKVHFAPFLRNFLTFSPLVVDKQQKMVEHEENIKFILDTQLNFMFSTSSASFFCVSARGLEVPLHVWQSWTTVGCGGDHRRHHF